MDGQSSKPTQLTKNSMLISFQSAEENRSVVERDFYRQFFLTTSPRYEVTTSPNDAGIIIITDLFASEHFLDFLKSDFYSVFKNKCIVITESDQPIHIFPGIYTSGKNRFKKQCIIGGAYPFHTKQYPNDSIKQSHYSSEKRYLFSFVGSKSHILREKMSRLKFNRADIVIRLNDSYNHFELNKAFDAKTMGDSYAETLKKSKFCLCPRGRGSASIRIFEVMKMGIAPVIISDDWIAPSKIDWSSCSIIIPEKDYASIESILEKHESSYEEMGVQAKNTYEQYFSEDAYVSYILNGIEYLKTNSSPLRSPFMQQLRYNAEKLYYKLEYYQALFCKGRMKLLKNN